MKHPLIIIAVVILAFVVAGCDPSLWPVEPIPRAQAFVSDASTVPQDLDALRSHFDPTAADYGSMLLTTFWDVRYFNESVAPFSLAGATDAGVGSYGATSVMITGTISNDVPSSDAIEFHLLPDPAQEGNWLIRAIIVDPGGAGEEIIENRM